MKTYLWRLLAGVVALMSGTAFGGAPFSQNFNGASSLNPGWVFESPNAASSMALTGTALNVMAAWQNGGSDLYHGSDYQAPRLLQPLDPTLDWTIETEVIYAPANNYEGAGLLLANTAGVFTNDAQFNRIGERYANPNSYIQVATGVATADSNTTNYLRVQKAGINYTGWWSVDGVNWTETGMVTQTNQWTYFGLFDIRQPYDNVQVDSSANFVYFNVTTNPLQVNTFTWTGAASTAWTNPNNWYPIGVPTNSSTVIINTGSPVIGVPTTLSSLTLNGGSLNAGPGLVVTNVFNWTAGTFAGLLTIPTNATLNLNDPGNQLVFPNATIVNNGTVDWLGGSLVGGGGTVITNNGSWLAQSDDQINANYGGQPVFYNNGTFTKSPTTGATSLNSVMLNNTGIVNVQSGTLVVAGGGTLAGSFNVSTNSALSISSGGLLNGSFVASLGGSVALSGGTFAYGSGLSFSGGGSFALSGSGSITLTNNLIPNLSLNGGTVTLSPTFQNGSITNLTLTGSTLAGNGAVTGVLNWLGGSMSGGWNIASGATLNVTGSAMVNQTAAITNFGHIVWSGSSNWRLQNNGGVAGTIWNMGGGVFDILCSQQLQNYYNSEYMVNYGLVRKMVDPGATSIQVAFNNSGTVSLLAGEIIFSSGSFGGSFSAANGTEMVFQNGGDLSGTFSSSYQSAIYFTSGTFTTENTVSFSGPGTMEQTGGTLTLLNNVIPNLILNGGTVNLPAGFQGGSISNLTLNNQTLTGSNVVTGTLNLTNCSVNGPLYVAVGATFNWGSGIINGPLTIADGATVNIVAPGGHAFGGMTTNAGTINWLGGEMRIQFNNGFYNQASGAFNIQCDQNFDNYNGGESFNNYGLITKSGSIGNTAFNPIINNYGNVSVQTGTITFQDNNQNQLLGGTFSVAGGAEVNFNGGGYLTGTYNAAAGGFIYLTGGTFTNTPTTTFEGAGTIDMNGGTITLISNFIPNLQITGGTLNLSPVFEGGAITNLTANANLSGSNYVTGVLNLNGNANGPLTLASNSVLNLNGTLSGPLTMMPTATINWEGGEIDANWIIPSNAVVNVIDISGHNFGGMTTNAGTFNWLGGEMRIRFNDGFFNLPGALFSIQCDQSLDSYNGGEYFNNYGKVVKSVTTAQTTINVSINNYATVSIGTGTISFNNNNLNQDLGGTFSVASAAEAVFNGGGHLTGTFTTAAGGLTLLNSGTFTNTPTTLFNGAGAAQMDNGFITLLSNLIPNLQITGGSVALSSVFQAGGAITNLTLSANLTGSSNYLAGVLNLSGNITAPLTLASNSILNWGGDVDATLKINPTATLNWTAGTITAATSIPSNAVLNLLGSGSHGFGANIANAGTVNWLNGEARILYNDTFNNLAGATFNIECDQHFDTYNGGEIFNNAGLLKKIGTFGTTAFSPIIQNTGTLDVESGAISFGNSSISQNAGVWKFGIGSGGAYGQIGFPNGLPLGGTLSVNVTNYVLGLSNQFPLVTYGSASGAFAATNLPGLGASWQLTYGPNAVLLTVTNLNAPSVALVTPANNQVFILPTSVAFSASTSDTFAAIQSVQYFQGTNLLGQATTSPYNFTWSSVSPGYYVVSALATDANGATATSAPVNISVFSGAHHATNYTWTGAVSTDWSTPGNWTPNNVPSALDTVFIANGTVNLATADAVSVVNFSGGTLQGAGLLTVTNAFNWTGGNLNNTLTIGTNATFSVAFNGQLNGCILNNYGTVLWSGGNPNGNSGTAITNYGLWLCQSDNGWTLNSSAPFVNNGTLRKTAYTGTSALRGMSFVNNGVVDAESGIISFQSGGSLTGTYNATNGAAVGFNGGSFTLNQTPTFSGGGGFYFQNGTLALAHDEPAALNLVGGTVTLGPSFQHSGSITNFTLDGSTLSGTNTLSGTMNWEAGYLNGQLTVTPTGVLNLTSGNQKTFSQCALINSGQVNWVQGTLSGDNDSVITNNNLWLAETDDTIGFNNGSSLFVNNGIFRKTAYTGSTSFRGLWLTNNGTVDAESGTIQFTVGGTLSGTYNAAAGAGIDFAGGNFTLGALPVITGAGAVYLDGGAMQALNNVPTNFPFYGGTLTLGPSFQNGGVITNLTIDGATLSGNYTVKGTLNFEGGSINGSLTIATNAALDLSGGSHNFSECLFTNFGTVTWTGGQVTGDGNTLLVNNGLWLAQSDDSINSSGSFINNSVYRKTSGGESDIYSIAFDNLGLVDVEFGLLTFQGGGALGGTYNTESFGAINVQSGAFTSPGSPAFVGAGPSQFNGGTLVLSRDQIPNLSLNGGNLQLTSTFQNHGAITNLTISGSTLQGSNYVTGSLNWLAGGLNGSQLIVATNGTLNILTGNDKNLPGSSLVNNGTVLWNGGRLRGNSSTFFTNDNLWLVQCDYALNADYGGNPSFFNTGVLEKAQTFGATTFNGVNLINSGTLSVQSGVVNFNNGGTYAQSEETLIFGVSAPNVAGQLQLPGPVNFDGNLQVQFLNGYAPSLQDLITPITYASDTSAFALLDLPSLPAGESWNVSYGATALNLTVFPPPSTNGAFQISGTVTDNQSHPISGVRVYATPQSNSFTNLIQNGSFEAPSIGSTAYVFYYPGATNIPGWNIIGPTNDNIALTSYNWQGPAEDGAQFMDPTGNTGGAGVSQTFTTTLGASYHLIFYHGTVNQHGINQVLGVAIGTNYYTFGETSGGNGDLDWRRVEIPFTANSNRTTLAFTELTGFDANDSLIDNVQVISSDYFDSLLEAVTDATGHYQITTPNATYQVDVSGLETAGYQDVAAQTVVINNANGVANFVASPLTGVQFYTITTAANPPTAATTSGGGSFTAGAGATVTATVTNALPYVFVNWTENGVQQSANASYSFTVLRAQNLVANFTLPVESIASTVNPANAGAVVGSGSFYYSTTNNLIASADFGYLFNHWSDQNGNTIGTSATLAVVALSNGVYTANFVGTNINHWVTTGTLPASLATVTGAGLYANGQVGSISAPAFVTNGLTYYQFSEFLLNGNAFTNVNAFNWTFNTTLQSNLALTAVYGTRSVLPLVIAARGNISNPVKATTNFVLKIQFDRAMQASTSALIVLTNHGATLQPTVPPSGTWSTTVFANDTYTTPGITFAHGMDGTNLVFVSQAIDLHGDAVAATNVLSVDVDATPPVISNVAVTPGSISATIAWNTDKPATSEVNYGPTTAYGSSTGNNAQLLTSHSMNLTGLAPLSAFHYQLVSSDQAGNQTVSPDATFSTIAAPDLQVTGLTASPGLTSGGHATISWVDTNSGSGPTFTPWYDQVTVSNSTTHQTLLSTTVYYDPSVNGNLTGDAGVARSYGWTLPNGTNGAGNLFITVTANIYSNQFELTTANNAASISASSSLGVYPDLRIVNVSATPASPISGSTVTLNWVDTNTGNGPVAASYADQVTVTNLTTSTILFNGQVNYNESSSGPIGANQGAPHSVSFTLPNGPAGVGTLAIGLLADVNDNIYEYNSGGTAKSNNTNALTVVSTLAPYPDLAVTNIIAPANVTAGGTLIATWVDVNHGNAPATNSWTENVFLSQDGTTNTSQLIGSFTHAGALAAGQAITNTNSIVLPGFVSGDEWVVVRINAHNEVYTLDQGHEESVSTQPTVVSSSLALVVSPATFAKNAANPAATGTVTRYGSSAAALTVSLSSDNPAAATVPTSVVIPAGQSSAQFPVNAVNTNIVEGTRTTSIVASATGFAGANYPVTVTDGSVPTVTVSVGATQVGVSTNPVISCSVSRNTITTFPLTVGIVTDPTALTAPATVTIPVGASSASFTVQTVNLHIPLAPYQATVNPAVSGYTSQAGSVTIVDDDAPSLKLSFVDTVISKGAVNPATQGALTVSTATTQAVTVLLSTVSPAITIPGSVVIPANLTNVTFPVNAVQDNMVTGDRVAVVTAQLSDAHSSAPLTATASTASITVTDDNGPALSVSLANTIIAENSSTTGTVTRNTQPTNALTVSLSSSLTTAASVPATVTIPSGSLSKTFTVTGVNPGVPTGPRTADITASATGFGSGVAPLVVSDINIPDLVITGITAPSSGLTTSNVTVKYVIANNGLGATTNNWHDAIYYSTSSGGNNPQLLTEVYETSALAVGQSRTNTITVTLPNTPGNDYIVVTANVDTAVLEANYQNDTLVSGAPIVNSPTYHAFIQAELTATDTPNPVPMNGYAYYAQAPNQHVPNVPVNIGVRVKGTERDYVVMTDANGNFTNTFQPIPGEAGHYGLTADYPNVPNATVQSAFDLYGVRITDTGETLKIYPNNPITNQTTVINLSDLPLTGVTVAAVGFPSALNVQLNLTNELGADDQAILTYTISATNISTAISAQAYIEVTSDQGAVAYLPFTLTLAPETALLVCNPTTLVSSMLIGQQTLLNFDVQNLGGAPSGPISLELPSSPWLTNASPTNLPSLAPGQSNRFTIDLDTALNLPLQVYQGSMFVAGANTGVSVPFAFRAISDAKGGLQVAVQDEYTFFVAGAPLVTNAQVVLTDPITGSVVASNTTGLPGTVLFTNVDQGTYQMTVSAPQHSTYQNPVAIQPGTVSDVTAFVSRETVSYTWVVVPTTIVDQYQVTLQAQFETEVPIPVVTIDNPFLTPLIIEGTNSEVDIQVSNHGLIAAQEISLNLPTDDTNFIFTPLSDYIDEIPAMSTITLPVLISWKTNTANPEFVKKSYARQKARAPRKNNISSCTPLPNISLNWSYVCGDDRHWHLEDVDLVETAVSSDCNILTKDCLDAGKSLYKNGVTVASACDVFSCITGCITDPCLNTILSTACGVATGNAQGAITGALHSGNCFCPNIPPLPYPEGSGPPPEGPPPTGGGGGGGGGGGIGGPTDPIVIPIGWDFAGCTPGETENGSHQILSVHKTDGPTTTAGDVCAHVTIQLNQKIAITRSAFQGTLTINDSDSNELSDVMVALSIVDDNGNSANDLFGIGNPALTGVTAVDGTGVIPGNSSGTVQYTFVPAHGAAPTLPVHYSVGGTMSYVQDSNTVSITLAPQDIYVYPDPVLNLDYFLQRDVIGDDPNAPGTITPQPFNLGLWVKNVGAGAALDFTITSAQPQIVENSKGLLINFQILGTEIGTNAVTPSLTADLGELDAGTTTVAVWQLMCSLAGRFVSYAATFQHMNQLGTVETSLIDNVNIHQMIHTFMVWPGDNGVPDFLVNDIPNPNNLPDTVYLSDGTTNPVTVVSGAQTDGPIGPGHMQATLTATMSPEWDYLEAADPGPGYKLYRAVRSDGLDMKVPYNVWTTPLSFPASQTGALHTNILHLVDFNGTGSYTLYYHTTNTTPPTVVGLQTVAPFVQNGPISSLQITFSEPIDLTTFGTNTLNLSKDGGPNLIDSGVTITLVTNSTYSINGLTGITGNQGNYQLTVNTANVQDFGGNNVAGNAVVSTSWAEGNPPMVVQSITPVTPNPRNTPVNSVTVTLDKAANAATFNYNAISLTLNGGANLSSSGITVSALNSTTFQINGLAALTGTAGTYVLTVNTSAMQDSGGNPGEGSSSVSWTVITTGPSIVAMTQPQSPRNIVILAENVTFSEPINPSTFTLNNLTLTLNGGPNLITSNVTITEINPTNYQIQNINWVIGYDGTYTLSVNAAGISDLAGNPCVGSSSVTWIMDTHPPTAPSNLAISPITGVYPNLTASNLVTVSGTIATNNLHVRVLDQTTSQDWGVATVIGTNFSAQLTLSQGSHTLQLYTVDQAANDSSNSFITVVVDQTPINAAFDTISPNPRLTPLTNLNVTFDKPMNITTIYPSNVVLTLNATNVSHPTFTMISSNVYQIGGLAALTSGQGTYQLTVNFNGMRDDAGNAGSGSASTSWQEVSSLLPVISQVGNVSLLPDKKLKLTLSANDPSSLPLNLVLGAGAPEGVQLANSILTWTPTCAQGTSSNYITVWAVEAVSPFGSNSMSFAVIVGDCADVRVGSGIVLAGTSGTVPLNLLATGNVTNLTFILGFPTNRLVNWTIDPSNSAVGALVVQGLNPTHSLFTLTSQNGQSLVGSSVIASLAFDTTTGSSAFIPLTLTGFAATEANNVSVGTTFSGSGRVVLVGTEPLLEAQLTNSSRELFLYGIPGNSYQIQSSANFGAPTVWSDFLRVPMTNLLFGLSNIAAAGGDIFYRAYEFAASPPILDAAGSQGHPALVAYGVKGTNYELQVATNVSASAQWAPSYGYTLSNSFLFINNITNSKPTLFYRIKTQ